MTDLDRSLVPVAERQHGIIRLTDLERLGASRQQADYRVRQGRWDRLASALYRISGLPATAESHLLAACLSSGRGAVASHRSAAWLWGLDGSRAARPEVSVHRHHKPAHLDALVHESGDLDLAERRIRRGIPVTGVNRTLLDLGAVLPLRRVEQSIDSALRLKLTTWPALYDTLVRHSCRGRNGCGPFRAILDERFGEKVIPDSWFERRVARLLTDRGVGRPVPQHRVTDDRGVAWSIDLAYPDRRVGIELQSKAHHLNAESFEQDAKKLNRLRLAGWTMLEFTWRSYVERPMELCADVRSALHRSGVDMSYME
jgi:hypothetical protein